MPVNLYLRYSATDRNKRHLYINGKEIQNVTSVRFPEDFSATPGGAIPVEITLHCTDVDIQIDNLDDEDVNAIASAASQEIASREIEKTIIELISKHRKGGVSA